MHEPRPREGGVGPTTRSLQLLAVLAALAFVLLLPTGVQAQDEDDPVLVSNVGQTAGTDLVTAADKPVYAQSFTTGSNTDGYFLSSVEVGLKAAPGVTFRVELWNSGTNQRGERFFLEPHRTLVALSAEAAVDNDASTLERFSANDVLLLPNTTYWIVVARTEGADDGLGVATTMVEDVMDDGGMAGFSLGDNAFFADTYVRDPLQQANEAEGMDWSDNTSALDASMKIRVRGSEATRPPGPYITNRNKQPRGEPAETNASTSRFAMSFTPRAGFGETSSSYQMTSVLLGVAAEAGVTPRVAIHADNNRGDPGARLPNGTLNAPADISRDLSAPGRAEFTATAPITLSKDTRYWVVLDVGSGTGKLSVSTTKTSLGVKDNIDIGRLVLEETAWEFRRVMRTYRGSSWSQDRSGRQFRMAINGTTDPYPGVLAFGLPQVGMGVVAEIEDFSARVHNQSWQWQRGESMDGPFTDIPAGEGGTKAVYVPSTADLGKWLKATVSYDDGFGTGKSASGVNPQPVLSQPVASTAGRPAVLGYILHSESESDPLLIAQAFSTGADSSGYVLSGVRLGVYVDTGVDILSWALHADDDGEPAAAPLFDPIVVPPEYLDSNPHLFKDLEHSGFLLSPDTTYWVVVSASARPDVTVKFEETSYAVGEGGSVDVVVTLSEDPERTVEVPITAVDLGSTSAGDYSGVPASVTFESGETRQTFSFTATDDAVDDDGEHVRLEFGSMPDLRVMPGNADTATVAIGDNDVPEVEVSFGAATYTASEGGTAAVTVTLSEDPKRTLEIPITTTNQGETGDTDYSVPSSVTFRSGETSRTLVFTAASDAVDDDGESVRLGFGTLPDRVTGGATQETTVSITEDSLLTVSFGATAYSAVEGGEAVVTVRLSEDPKQTVTVPITVTNLGGAGASDYSGVPGSVTFNSGDTLQTFTISAKADHLVETGEELKLAFGPLPSGTVAASPAETTVSLSDSAQSQTVPPTVHFGASSYRVTEGEAVEVEVEGEAVEVEAEVEVTVTLSKAPGSDAVVPITTTHQGGAGDGDYSGVPDSVTFGPEETSKTITLTATDDYVDDDEEGVLLGFGTLPGGHHGNAGRGCRDHRVHPR